MRDLDKEVLPATKSSQGLLQQRDKCGSRANTHAFLLLFFFVVFEWKHLWPPCLNSLHSCTSLKSKWTHACPSWTLNIIPQIIFWKYFSVSHLLCDSGRAPRLLTTFSTKCIIPHGQTNDLLFSHLWDRPATPDVLGLLKLEPCEIANNLAGRNKRLRGKRQT